MLKTKNTALIICVTILFSVFMLSACNSRNTTLNAPIIQLNNKVVSWQAVDGADSYTVIINDVTYPDVLDTTFDLTFLDEDGNYEISVSAHSDKKRVKDSAPSERVVYVLQGKSTETYTLSTPENLYISSNVLYFDAVANADIYAIYVDGNLYVNVTVNSCNLPDLPDGEHYVEVVAGANRRPQFKASGRALLRFTVQSGRVLKEKLNVPDGISVNGNVLTWNKVKGSSGYYVRINGQQSSLIAETKRTLTMDAPDRYVIEVMAVGNEKYDSSDYSDPIILPLSLPYVQNVVAFNNVVQWSSVDNAISYTVELDGVLYNNLEIASFDIPQELIDGTHSVRVRAVGDDILYTKGAFSNEYTFELYNGQVKKAVLGAPQNLKITEGYISWDAVDMAIGYEVEINEQTYVCATTYIRTDTDVYINAKVRAIGNGKEYDEYGLFSDQIQYNYSGLILKDAPYDVKIKNGIITWQCDFVPSGYSIMVDGVTYLSFTNELNLSSAENGEYVVKVRAEGMDYAMSGWSAEYRLTIPDEQQQISVPEPILNGTVISWSSLGEDFKYLIECNGDTVAYLDETEYDLSTSEYMIYSGEYAFTVRAEKDEKTSARSYEVIYSFIGKEREPEVLEISSIQDLHYLNEYKETKFVLVSDLDFNGAVWQPIELFQSEFDGNGHKISNVNISGTSLNTAMFLQNNGYIHNLKIEKPILSFTCAQNSIAEYVSVICVINNGIIKDVTITEIQSDIKCGILSSSCYVAVNNGVIAGAELDGTMLVSNNADEVVFTVSGAVCENYGYCDIKVALDINVQTVRFSEANVAGVIGYNSKDANVLIKDGDLNINLLSDAETYLKAGGVMLYNRPSSTENEIARSICGVNVSDLIKSGVYIKGGNVNIEINSDSNVNLSGGVVLNNYLKLDVIELSSISINSVTSEGAKLSGLVYDNSSTINSIVVSNLSLNSHDKENSNNQTVYQTAYVYLNSGNILNGIIGEVSLISDTFYQNNVICGVVNENAGVLKNLKITALSTCVVSGKGVINGVFAENAQNGNISNCMPSLHNVVFSGTGNAEICGIGQENKGHVDNASGVVNITSNVISGKVKRITLGVGYNYKDAELMILSLSGAINVGKSDDLFVNEITDTNVALLCFENKGKVTSVNISGTTTEAVIKSSVQSIFTFSGAFWRVYSTGECENVFLSNNELGVNSIGVSVSVGGVAFYNEGKIKNVHQTNLNVNAVVTSANNGIKISGITENEKGDVETVSASATVKLNLTDSVSVVSGAFYEVDSSNVRGVTISQKVNGVVGSYAAIAHKNYKTITHCLALSDVQAQSSKVSLGVLLNYGALQSSVTYGQINGTDLTSVAICDKGAMDSAAILTKTAGSFVDSENVINGANELSDFISSYRVGDGITLNESGLPVSKRLNVNLFALSSEVTLTNSVTLNAAQGNEFDLNTMCVPLSQNGMVSALLWNQNLTDKRINLSSKGIANVRFNGSISLTVSLLTKGENGLTLKDYEIIVSSIGYLTVNGEGTTIQPFIIDKIELLRLPEMYPSDCYRLSTDLIIENDFEPLCSVSSPFTGVFDGAGYTLTFNKITVKDNMSALFISANSAEIRNVNIRLKSITVADKTSILCTELTNSTVNNVSAEIRAIELSCDALNFGGLIWNINQGSEVFDCSVHLEDISVTAVSISLSCFAAVNNGTAYRNFIKCELSLKADYSFVGAFAYTNNGIIRASYSSGIIESECSVAYIGGFVYDNEASISSSYSTMRFIDKTSNDKIGGFAVLNAGEINACYVDGYSIGVGENAYSFVATYDLVKNANLAANFKNCYVTPETYGYAGLYPASYLAFDGVKNSDPVALLGISEYYETLNGRTVLKSMPAQSSATLDLIQTESLPTFSIDCPQNLMAYFSNPASFDVTFVNAKWEVVSGAENASIFGTNLYVSGQGSATIKYSIGTHSKTFDIDCIIFDEGSGTELDPYIIRDALSFARIEFIPSAYYRIAADSVIDFNNQKTNICSEIPFSGTLDGNGAVITGLYIESEDSNGLFAKTNGAVIKNLSIIEQSATASYVELLAIGDRLEAQKYVGTLIGSALNTVVTNVQISTLINYNSKMLDISATQGITIGGIIGYGENVSIQNATVAINYSNGGLYSYTEKITLGAFVGEGSNITTSNCSATINSALVYSFDRESGTAVTVLDITSGTIIISDVSAYSYILSDVNSATFDVTAGIVTFKTLSLDENYDFETITISYSLSDNLVEYNCYFTILNEEEQE